MIYKICDYCQKEETKIRVTYIHPDGTVDTLHTCGEENCRQVSDLFERMCIRFGCRTVMSLRCKDGFAVCSDKKFGVK